MAIFVAARVFGQSTHARATAALWLLGCPHGHFRRGEGFWAKHTRSRAPSLAALPVITWRLRLVTVMAGLWSVVAEAVVRACLTSIGIVQVLLRRLGLPRALGERGYRPSARGYRAHETLASTMPDDYHVNYFGVASLSGRGVTCFQFLHLGPNSAYASFGYRQSGRWPFPGGDAAGGRGASGVLRSY
jgi:hypothetical protein